MDRQQLQHDSRDPDADDLHRDRRVSQAGDPDVVEALFQQRPEAVRGEAEVVVGVLVDPEEHHRADDRHATLGRADARELAARLRRVGAMLEGVEAQRGPHAAVLEAQRAQVLDLVDPRAGAHVGAGERPPGEDRAQALCSVRECYRSAVRRGKASDTENFKIIRGLRQKCPVIRTSAPRPAPEGDVTLLKNNRDSQGSIYGSHENYEATIGGGFDLFVWRAGIALLFPFFLPVTIGVALLFLVCLLLQAPLLLVLQLKFAKFVTTRLRHHQPARF